MHYDTFVAQDPWDRDPRAQRQFSPQGPAYAFYIKTQTQHRQEYWTLGVRAYWIVDPQRWLVVLLRRGKSDWIDECLGPGGICTTSLLPGFQLACDAIFELAARAEGETR